MYNQNKDVTENKKVIVWDGGLFNLIEVEDVGKAKKIIFLDPIKKEEIHHRFQFMEAYNFNSVLWNVIKMNQDIIVDAANKIEVAVKKLTPSALR